MLFYLNVNRGFETFLKIATYSRLIEGPHKIEYYQNRLKVLRVEYPILGFFQLVLGVSSKFAPNIVNKSLGIFKNFLKEGFKLGAYNYSNVLGAVFVLNLSKADSPTEK